MEFLTEFNKFSIQAGYNGREAMAVISAAASLGFDYVRESVATPGNIPIGSVEYCQPLFIKHEIDFYPEFFRKFFHRRIMYSHGSYTVKKRSFIKPIDAWKTDGYPRIVEPGDYVPSGRFAVSDVVNFVQEWRYYVARGDVVTTGWYRGYDEDEPAPSLIHEVSWPYGFGAAVDFGRMDNGKLALVECHAPFACGWYGDNHRDYLVWQIEAWKHGIWQPTSWNSRHGIYSPIDIDFDA